MVSAERAGNETGLSYEAFLALARQAGIDLSGREDLTRLYEDVVGVLRDIAALEAIDAGSTEPADVYAAGDEVP